MLKNCGDQSKLVSSEIKFLLLKQDSHQNYETTQDQIKNNPQDLWYY